MEPKRFKESNITFTKPGSMPDCSDLPAYRNKNQIISCWKASWRDRLKILFRGEIWIGIVGQAQPPMWTDSNVPFYRATLKDNMKYWNSEIEEHFQEDDKQYHLFAGEVIAIVVALVFAHHIGIGHVWGSLIGFVAGVLAGFVKDFVWDKWLKKGTFDWWDIGFTSGGSLIGALIVLIVGLIMY